MKKFIITALILAPGMVFAQQGAPSLNNLDDLLESIGDLVEAALPILIGLGLVVFLWGLVKFIFSGTEEKEKGKTLMIWGLVALFIMVSVWGIIRWVGDAIGIDQGDTIEVPGVQDL